MIRVAREALGQPPATSRLYEPMAQASSPSHLVLLTAQAPPMTAATVSHQVMAQSKKTICRGVVSGVLTAVEAEQPEAAGITAGNRRYVK